MENVKIKQGQIWQYNNRRLFYIKTIVSEKIINLQEISPYSQQFPCPKSNFENSSVWKLLTFKKTFKIWKI